jgi:hypothetical protein
LSKSLARRREKEPFSFRICRRLRLQGVGQQSQVHGIQTAIMYEAALYHKWGLQGSVLLAVFLTASEGFSRSSFVWSYD